MASFKRFTAKTFFKIVRWKVVGDIPDVPKYVMVIAPHTSFLDVIYGKMYNWLVDMKATIMIKEEFFFFPMGALLRHWGGIPINRKYPGGIIAQMTEEFNKSEKMILSITPEGTRSPNPDWKTGFYRIAVSANVPIYLTLIDFKSKTLGFLGEHKITGDMKSDINAIKERYRGMEGYRKGKFVI
ncbi:MAG: 1-acyl-sn-glycerol-3-phosphate acyltransferase [Bacteroidales bacterium]|nr:1-acyl-sn-glycerol-3-phosphate acyltransferase [Bacteroidales bacterium]